MIGVAKFSLSIALWLGLMTFSLSAQSLGPVDGHDLPATDLERVQVGSEAPDFILTDLTGQPVKLSSFRNQAPVVLVFYRGQW